MKCKTCDNSIQYPQKLRCFLHTERVRTGDRLDEQYAPCENFEKDCKDYQRKWWMFWCK